MERPFAVSMEADGFTIEPAGEVREGAGHLHLMVDAGCVAPGQEIPEDADHLHFGDGATETDLDLPAGDHTLCLQAGDGAHTALDLTDQITITVVEPGGIGGMGAEEWEGALTGIGRDRRGPCFVSNEGEFTIDVSADGTATLEGTITATGGGGCAPYSATSELGTQGQRTPSGFRFPIFATNLVIDVSGNHGVGTATGEGPDQTWEYEFEIDCVSGCPSGSS